MDFDIDKNMPVGQLEFEYWVDMIAIRKALYAELRKLEIELNTLEAEQNDYSPLVLKFKLDVIFDVVMNLKRQIYALSKLIIDLGSYLDLA